MVSPRIAVIVEERPKRIHHRRGAFFSVTPLTISVI